MRQSLLVIAALSIFISTAEAQKRRFIRLVDRKPAAVEAGSVQNPYFKDKPHGPGKWWLGPWEPSGQARAHWPDTLKIVKTTKDLTVPEVKDYRSWNHEVFLSGGKPVTGIGLWVKAFNMYHWVEYEIPRGSRSFSALVLTSDDPGGHTWMHQTDKAQHFIFKVLVDGKVVQEQKIGKYGLRLGSGAVIADIDLDLEATNKKIRFHLEGDLGVVDSSWNIEVLVSEGEFRP